MSGLRNYFALNAQILYWIFLAPVLGKPRFKFAAGFPADGSHRRAGSADGVTDGLQHRSDPGHARRVSTREIWRNLLRARPGFAHLAARELGPLLVGVVVIGRSGSAITAELGTMKVSEEIEALQVMAINPIRFLVVPRFLAMLVMLPVLTIFGNYIGFVGGWSICHFALDMNTNAFILRLVGSAHPIDLYAGIVKSFVFAWLIATIACQAGLEVTGGAEGVGQSTTSSVVVSIIAMLVANAVLTAIFFFAAPN